MTYSPEGTRDTGWLGYVIGNNTHLRELHLRGDIFEGFNNTEPFFRGANSNRSIQKISFDSLHLVGGEIFGSLRPFFENNDNLSELRVAHCGFKAGCVGQLSSVLKGCHKSQKRITLANNQMGGERLVVIIDALNAHPQLEELRLVCSGVGTNECRTLADVLRHTIASELRLYLRDNDIDDEGMDMLVGALANSRLSALSLSARLCWNTQTPTWRSYSSDVTTWEMKGHSFSQMHWPETAD